MKKTLPWQHNDLWTWTALGICLKKTLDWPWNMALERPWTGLGMVLGYGLRIVLK